MEAVRWVAKGVAKLQEDARRLRHEARRVASPGACVSVRARRLTAKGATVVP